MTVSESEKPKTITIGVDDLWLPGEPRYVNSRDAKKKGITKIDLFPGLSSALTSLPGKIANTKLYIPSSTGNSSVVPQGFEALYAKIPKDSLLKVVISCIEEVMQTMKINVDTGKIDLAEDGFAQFLQIKMKEQRNVDYKFDEYAKNLAQYKKTLLSRGDVSAKDVAKFITERQYVRDEKEKYDGQLYSDLEVKELMELIDKIPDGPYKTYFKEENIKKIGKLFCSKETIVRLIPKSTEKVYNSIAIEFTEGRKALVYPFKNDISNNNIRIDATTTMSYMDNLTDISGNFAITSNMILFIIKNGETISKKYILNNDKKSQYTIDISSVELSPKELLKKIASVIPPKVYDIQLLNDKFLFSTNYDFLNDKNIPAGVESPAPESVAESPASESVVESPASESVVESPASESVVESPAPESVVESPAPESVVESPAPESVVESPAPESVVESPAPESVVESPAPESVVESPAPESVVESPASESVVESPAPESVVESPASESVVETPAPESVVESPVSKSVVESPASESVVESPAPDQHPNIYSNPPETFNLQVNGKTIQIKKGDCFTIDVINKLGLKEKFKGQINRIFINNNFSYYYEKQNKQQGDKAAYIGTYSHNKDHKLKWDSFILEDCKSLNYNGLGPAQPSPVRPV